MHDMIKLVKGTGLCYHGRDKKHDTKRKDEALMCKPKEEYIEVCEVIKKVKPNENDDRSEGFKMYIKTTREEKSRKVESDFSVNYPSNDIISAEAYRLKHHIYHEVQSLRTNNNVLLSTYAGNSLENSDIENLLFYNIGTGAFSKIFQKSSEEKQVAFKMDTTSQEDKFSYKYTYEVVEQKVVKEELDKKKLIAKWNVTIGSTLPQKADEYYDKLRAAMRSSRVESKEPNKDEPGKNEVMLYSSERCDETAFGIKITLTVPASNTTTHPVSVMKHLLDGVICAFHGEKGETAQRLKEKFKDKDVTCQDDWHVLGYQDYLRKYGNGVKWNPADEADRLQFGWIVVEHENEGKEYKMSGEIYKWNK